MKCKYSTNVYCYCIMAHVKIEDYVKTITCPCFEAAKKQEQEEELHNKVARDKV